MQELMDEVGEKNFEFAHHVILQYIKQLKSTRFIVPYPKYSVFDKKG